MSDLSFLLDIIPQPVQLLVLEEAKEENAIEELNRLTINAERISDLVCEDFFYPNAKIKISKGPYAFSCGKTRHVYKSIVRWLVKEVLKQNYEYFRSKGIDSGIFTRVQACCRVLKVEMDTKKTFKKKQDFAKVLTKIASNTDFKKVLKVVLEEYLGELQSNCSNQIDNIDVYFDTIQVLLLTIMD
jgi:hypothetical protein